MLIKHSYVTCLCDIVRSYIDVYNTHIRIVFFRFLKSSHTSFHCIHFPLRFAFSGAEEKQAILEDEKRALAQKWFHPLSADQNQNPNVIVSTVSQVL